MSLHCYIRHSRDVTKTTPVDGDLLRFDTATMRWGPFSGLTATFTVLDSSSDPWTLVFENGILISRTSVGGGTPGEWQFNDAVNSGQILTIGF